MTEPKLFLADSNILVYAYDKSDIVKKKKAEELLGKCFDGLIELAVSNQNLAEFVYVTTRKSKLSYGQAFINIKDFVNAKTFKKIDYSAKTLISALEIAEEFKMSFWDSLLAATMRENGIFNIYTENTKDFKMPWINAVNPFN